LKKTFSEKWGNFFFPGATIRKNALFESAKIRQKVVYRAEEKRLLKMIDPESVS
jgi:hypothetical protein